MDGFDDLLAPSRSILEDNPFADPFAKRSNSPDPWASPFAHGHSDDDFNQSTTPPTNSDTSTTANTYISDSNVVTESASVLSDPLDYATQVTNEDENNKPRSRSTSPIHKPGFRESTSPNFSEIATIRPTEPEDREPSTPSPVEEHRSSTPGSRTEVASTTPLSPVSQEDHHAIASLSQSSSRVDSPSPSISKYSEFVSPLGRSPQINIGHSISRPLGGEVLGGWQSESSQVGWGAQTEDDSDDDKPIAQTVKVPEHLDNTLSSNTSSLTRNENGLQPIFVISVDDPQKVGDPIRSFTMYTVHTRTTSPLFQKSAFSVLRRYSDFLWLYETLSTNNPGVVVPPVPEKNPFGRFDDHFVRQRRFALEKCIQKIANHPVLSKDADLRMFLESDTFALDIKHRKAEIAHERGGLMASIGQTIAGPRFHETDEWFDRQKSYLDSLESQLRGLVKAIEVVARQRSELATATGEFSQAATELSSSDVGKQLSQSLAGLAEVEQKAQDIQNTQSEQDMVTLMGTVDEYARLISSVRLAFSSRIRIYHAWRTADADLLRTKQTHEKNRSQGRIPTERLGYSLSQIAEAERRALDAKHEFDHVSKLIKSEVARFEQERVEDFKNSLHAFLEGMISRQKELISTWENYQQMLLKRVGGGGVQSRP